MSHSLMAINQMSQADFVRVLGPVFEATPAIAAQVWTQRPFTSVADLHQRMVTLVEAMTRADQLALIQAHPDLGSRVAMAEASVAEQQQAGLSTLTPQEYEQFQALNQQYKQTFGFPFILAVAGHTKASILATFAQRVNNSPEVERATALGQIAAIAQHRLEAWIDQP